MEKSETLLSHADKDGVVCIPAVRGERPAAERLLDLLRAAYSPFLAPPSQGGVSGEWSDAILHKLLTDAGGKPGTPLDEWLRDRFFEQHCKLFHQRPFIWHIWDGRKDGFSCLVNYHKLNHQRLETLTYPTCRTGLRPKRRRQGTRRPGPIYGWLRPRSCRTN